MDDITNDTTRQDAARRDSYRQPASIDASHYTLTVEEASARFADAGLPRSVRSIQRYCKRGHLSCTTVDTEIAEMYLIDPDSVERRIEELRQVEMVTRTSGVSRQDAANRDTSRHDATVRDTSRQAVSDEKIEEYERRIKELEDKAMHLEIDKRAREQIINMLNDDRQTLFAQVSEHVRTITNQARVIGQLETRLELGPGRPSDHGSRAAPVTNVEPEQPRTPSPQPRTGYVGAEQVREEPTTVEYPPRYSGFAQQGKGDNSQEDVRPEDVKYRYGEGVQ